MLILFHFPASVPITVIPNKETERGRETKYSGEERKKKKKKLAGVK